MKKTIYCIVGPTASGKTSLSIALAKQINAEIISADSMQIYQDLDIATAKVTKEEMDGVVHHMIDICPINQNFSVADFKDMCYHKIKDIIAREKNVIIVGGTGLYISAVVQNMQFIEEIIDTSYREELTKLAQEKSPSVLYEMLQQCDPESAKYIHPNNVKRVIRALEMAKNHNTLKSQHMEQEKRRLQSGDIPYEFKVYEIVFPREVLYERINKRVDKMIEQGVVEEAKKVYEMGLSMDNTCMQAIGYKEFFPYFEGKCTLDEAIAILKQDTRKYAKRQMTWFRHKLKTIPLEGTRGTEYMLNQILE